MDNPLVSIIMPVYNTGEILHDTIKSIQSQSFSNFELILVDDGSTDGSGEICEQYVKKDLRIKVFHQQNGGICDARNLGLSKLRGKYVAFCDHDDLYYPELLRKSVEVAEQYECNVVKFGAKVEDEVKYKISLIKYADNETLYYLKKDINSRIIELMNNGIFGTIWTALYNSDFLKENNLLFDTHFKHGGEDFDFNIRVFKYINSMVILPDILYTHFIRSSLSTSAKFYDDILYDFIKQNYTIRELMEYLGVKIYDIKTEYLYCYMCRVIAFVLYAIKMHKSYSEIRRGLEELHSKCEILNFRILFAEYTKYAKTSKLKFVYIIYSLFKRKQFIFIYIFLKFKYIVDKLLMLCSSRS